MVLGSETDIVLHFWDFKTGSPGFGVEKQTLSQLVWWPKAEASWAVFEGGRDGIGACMGKEGSGQGVWTLTRGGGLVALDTKASVPACTRPNSMSELVSGGKGAFQTPNTIFASNSSLYNA